MYVAKLEGGKAKNIFKIMLVLVNSRLLGRREWVFKFKILLT